MNEKTKVLLVDDEKGITTIMKMNLERTGNYVVVTENQPTQVLERALAFKPDIVVLDMVMPEMDGGDVKRQLNENETLKDIPVIFLTALVSRDDISPGTQLIESGDGVMIPKPVTTELLTRVISETLAGNI